VSRETPVTAQPYHEFASPYVRHLTYTRRPLRFAPGGLSRHIIQLCGYIGGKPDKSRKRCTQEFKRVYTEQTRTRKDIRSRVIGLCHKNNIKGRCRQSIQSTFQLSGRVWGRWLACKPERITRRREGEPIANDGPGTNFKPAYLPLKKNSTSSGQLIF